MNDEKPILLGYWEGNRWKQARAVFSGGLSPTLTAEMGGHGNNYVYVTITENKEKEERDGTEKVGKDHGDMGRVQP